MTPPPPLRGAGTLRRLRYTGALRGVGADLNALGSLRKLRSLGAPLGVGGQFLVGEVLLQFLQLEQLEEVLPHGLLGLRRDRRAQTGLVGRADQQPVAPVG